MAKKRTTLNIIIVLKTKSKQRIEPTLSSITASSSHIDHIKIVSEKKIERKEEEYCLKLTLNKECLDDDIGKIMESLDKKLHSLATKGKIEDYCFII